MKILSLGLDKSILDKNSPLAKRTIEYGNLVEKYTVIAPSKKYKEIVLSEQANAVGAGVGNNKITALFKIYKIAKKLLTDGKYDIITVQDQYYLALVGWMLAKKFNIGLEIQIHGFEKYYGLRKLIAKFIIPKADAVRAVSQRLKKQLIEEFGVKGDNITVVPIFSDIGYRISDIGYNKVEDKFIFLTVGRLVPVKNIEMQIKALTEVIKNLEVRSKKLELWIVGEGEESKKLEVRSKKLGLDNFVKFFGWQEDLKKFYRQADAFLLTSDYEGWGLVVIEAASYGLPIIMTDVGCAGEVIKDGESGIVIPVGDQRELEESMADLIKNNELKKRLGENAQKVVNNLLSKEETLNLYKKSWETALNRKL